MSIKIDDRISLETLDEMHAGPLYNLVNTHRAYLKEWLPWVDQMQTIENAEKYISECNRREMDKTDFAYAIMFEKGMVGRIGLHYINYRNKIGEIGYWLAEGWQGRGIITKCCTALINHAFTVLNLNRIEIKCGTGNHKSQAIAERLHFKLEGTLHQAELLQGKFIDLNLYSLLKADWAKPNP